MVIGAVNTTTSGIVSALLQHGALVMAPVKSLQHSNWLKETTGHITTGRLMTHITDMPDFEKANDIAENIVEKFGRIDIAVNAMVANKKDTGLTETDMCDWENMLEENITPCFVMNRIIISIMKQEQEGVYISVSEKIPAGKTCSSLSKMANTVQMQILQQFAEEAESNGIRYYHLLVDNAGQKELSNSDEKQSLITPENIGAEILKLYTGQKVHAPLVD